MNQERQKANLPPLAWGGELEQIAATRVMEIENNFSHIRPNGKIWSTLLADHNIEWWANGENIARGPHNPEEAVACWMNSPSHRENILFAGFTSMAVAVKRDQSGVLIWSQIFLGKGA